MIQKIEIENYKSIEQLAIELGRINVFIGDNGCGKTNILEAVAFASAFEGTDMVNNETFFWKGIRHAKPELIYSSFNDNHKEQSVVKISFAFENSNKLFELIYKNSIDKWEKIDTHFYRYKKFVKEGDPLDIAAMEALDAGDWRSYYELMSEMNSRSVRYIEIENFVIYQPNILMLRGWTNLSQLNPVGIYGERLDELIDGMKSEEISKLKEYRKFISWLKDFDASGNDHKRLKLHKSNSNLSFLDRFMRKGGNSLSAEIVNEGVLFVLFYLSLFISDKTPAFFAIDNIEQSWNPHLCRVLMEELCKIAKESNKQALITTHNPAILDGLNLHNDEIRLFEVHRDKKGRTKVRRIKTIKEFDDKLSNLWTGGILGGISKEY